MEYARTPAATFVDSVRASCSERHPELKALVAWAQSLAEAGDVILEATRSTATSVLKLRVPGSSSSLATLNHDVTGEHVYIKIWRSQVEKHASAKIETLERATRGRLGAGFECRAPFDEVVQALSETLALAASEARNRPTEPRTQSPHTEAWSPYVPVEEHAGLARPRYEIDPTERDERTRAHFRLQNEVAAFLESRGLTVEQHRDVGVDLSWCNGSLRWLGEIKTVSLVSETRQIRLGIGQLGVRLTLTDFNSAPAQPARG